MFLIMRESVHIAVDDELMTRFNGVRRFTQGVFQRSSSIEDVQYEFREHSGLKPGGDLMQVSDAQRNWTFQSRSIRPYNVPISAIRQWRRVPKAS
jgi:hypothetical protein